MTDAIKTSELFCPDSLYLKEIFNRYEYPWQILNFIKEEIKRTAEAYMSDFVCLTEGVYVGKNVNIHPSAVIIPPAVIGDCCELRSGAFLRGNVITGKNCVIGNSTELKNCILCDNAQAPHYNYIGDSVLGCHAHMGAGAVLSNLKADGSEVIIRGKETHQTGRRKVGAFLADGADIGCGCVLNPGTVIGKNSRVYPLTAVRGIIPAGSIVKTTENIVKIK